MNDDLEVTVALADHTGELRVLRLEGREAISRLFRFDVDVVSPDGGVLPDDVAVGSKATITFRRGGEHLRHFHGVLSKVTRGGRANHGRPMLHLRLVPRAARAKLIKTQEVFLDKSVADIIAGKLDLVRAGAPPGDPKATPHYGLDAGSYKKRDLVVQYKETDFDFVCRLAEDSGISFHFEHGDKADRICLADSMTGLQNSAQASTIRLTSIENEPDRVHSLQRSDALVPGSYVVYDYNYRRAEEVIWPKRDAKPPADVPPGTIFEYGAHAKNEDHAKAIHAIRVDEVRCRRSRYQGASSIIAMAAGGQAGVEASGSELDGTKLLITSVRHSLGVEPGALKLVYRNTFRAVGVEHTYRPRRRTKRPRIDGVVTGVIQGPNGSFEGDAAYIDDDARYLVQFHFDWAAEPGQRASRWMRMAQPFGGKGTDGMQFPLKPGAEVVLAFVDGDPDRPVILGAIPNVHARSPVDAKSATLHRVTTADGIVVQFGKR